MNKFSLLIYIFTFFFPTITVGQDDETRREEKTKKVKMPKYYKAWLPKKSIAVSDIQIMQAVPDSTRLGFVQKGMDNHKVVAVPAENLTIFLQEYITKQYENDYRKDGVKLLLVVKNLRINERTFYSAERAFARLHADSYFSKDGTHYNFLVSVDTVQVGGGADVTAFHGENIAAALHKLIIQSLNKAESDPVLSDGIAIDSLISNARKVTLHPIQKATRYREGVYVNFQEFLLNDPSLKNYYAEIESNGSAKVFQPSSDSIKTEISFWGLCKGGEIYKYHENKLVLIEKYGYEFMISGYIDKANRRNRSLFSAGLAGGALGGAVGGAIAGAFANADSDRPYSVTAIPYITKKQPEASVIDMKTGEFIF